MPGIHPLLSVGLQWRRSDFADFGNVNSASAYQEIISEKLKSGEGTGLNAFSFIHIVNQEEKLVKVLGKDLTWPKSSKLKVTDLGENKIFVEMVNPPKVDIPNQSLLGDPDLSIINEYAPDDSNSFSFDPHCYPDRKLQKV